MALSKSRLATNLAPVIESKMRSIILDGDNTPYPKLADFAQAMAEAIADEVVDEITANAEITNGQITGLAEAVANGDGTRDVAGTCTGGIA